MDHDDPTAAEPAGDADASLANDLLALDLMAASTDPTVTAGADDHQGVEQPDSEAADRPADPGDVLDIFGHGPPPADPGDVLNIFGHGAPPADPGDVLHVLPPGSGAAAGGEPNGSAEPSGSSDPQSTKDTENQLKADQDHSSEISSFLSTMQNNDHEETMSMLNNLRV